MSDSVSRIQNLTPDMLRLITKKIGADKGTDRVESTAPSNRAEGASSTQRFYNHINRLLDASPFGPHSSFLNYGYALGEGRSHSRITLPAHFINQNSAQLVLELIGETALNGRRVLDVGCGRGGAVSLIHQFFLPASLVGLDASIEAIRFCRNQYSAAGLSFLHGDSQNLPFPRASFDVVINIESSHCYPDRRQFYAEVYRVLSDSGYFLYTDLLTREEWEISIVDLTSLGFRVVLDRDITANVLRSCEEVSTQRVQAFCQQEFSRETAELLGTPYSTVYEHMRRRESLYRIFTLVKHSSESQA